MEIYKTQIVEMLLSRGHGTQARQADSELPVKVDTAEHPEVLGKFGIAGDADG